MLITSDTLLNKHSYHETSVASPVARVPVLGFNGHGVALTGLGGTAWSPKAWRAKRSVLMDAF